MSRPKNRLNRLRLFRGCTRALHVNGGRVCLPSLDILDKSVYTNLNVCQHRIHRLKILTSVNDTTTINSI